MTEQWDSAFEDAVRTHLKLLADGVPLHPDSNLQELGLDSMPMVELVVDLEEMYQVTFSRRIPHVRGLRHAPAGLAGAGPVA